jgi:hypothetical protein
MTGGPLLKNKVQKYDAISAFTSTNTEDVEVKSPEYLSFGPSDESSTVRIFHGLYTATTRND